MKIEIEWPSHFRPDGTKRTPPPSRMHGWLAKMRGTLLGNEDLRSKGIQEMGAARSKKRQPRRTQAGKSIFSIFRVSHQSKKSQPTRLLTKSRGEQGSTRPRHPSKRSSKPSPRPPGGPRRSTGQSSHRQGSSRPQHGHRRPSRR